jgi:dihydroflavonol-4-reductase
MAHTSANQKPGTIFLTGPDGILGNNLIPILIGRGFHVRALIQKGRNADFTESLGAQIVYGDILNQEEIAKTMAGCDYVIHAAANTNIWPTRDQMIREVNLEGTRNVIQAVLANQVKKMIHIGTANSFGFGSKKNPGDETLPYACAPYRLDYMDSKYEAQKLVLSTVKESGLQAIILNPTFMIGPFDFKPSSGQLIISVYKNKVPGYTNGGRNYVYVKDVATAITNAIEIGKVGECYILGNENLSYQEMFDKISRATGAKPIKRLIPPVGTISLGAILSVAGKIFNYNPGVSFPVARISNHEQYYSNDKAVRELGLPQTPIDLALQDAFQWLKTEQYL